MSPWAIRLAVTSVEEAGEVAGRLYALSTAGSLVGTLLSALLLIPAVGTRRTFLIFALAIAVVAVIGLRPAWRYAAAPVAIALAMLIPVGTLKAQTGSGRVIYETDTEYQYARVIERDDGSRMLELNEGQAVHSLYRPETVLTGDYWDGLLVLPFTSRASRRGGWPSWATPPAPRPARTGGCSPRPGSTGWSWTPSCRISAAATSACTTRG